MTFDSSITDEIATVFGDKKMTYGTYTCESGDTGGDVDTGLKIVEQFFIQPTGGTASTSSVNETLPVAGSAVTIVTADNVSGNWMAIGRDA